MRRQLGQSGVRVTSLSFGSASIGGLYAPISRADAVLTIRRALDVGMRYLDTAPHYGAGTAEKRLGIVLRDVPRDTFTISTKVGRLLRPLQAGEKPDDSGFPDEPALKREWDFSAAGIRRSLEGSLERLGLDRVDIAYLHDPETQEDEIRAVAYPALAKLREEGLVRAIGAGMNHAGLLARYVRTLDLDVVLCAGRYTLLDQSALTELLPACAERGTSVVVGGAYNSGLLAGGATYDYQPAPPAMLDRVRRMREVCAAYGVPLRAAALRFPLGHPAVASVLAGCRTHREAEDNAAQFGHDIPADLWAELLPAGVPAP